MAAGSCLQRVFANRVCKRTVLLMRESVRRFEVTDERALEALAHRVGESSGVTSYHLRRLADVGLIEEDPDRGTRRERWWRSAYELTSWSPADFLGNPETHRASVSMRREIYRWQWRLLEQWLAEEPGWDKAWVDAAGPSDHLLRLTPEQTKMMSEEIWSVVQRYRDQPAAADASDAARVVWVQHLVPVRGEFPL
jgi:DNA-binding transcriptional ArsR family regulator